MDGQEMSFNVAELVSNIGIVGALVWYLYYTTSVTLPKRDKHYTESVEHIANGFQETIRDERKYREAEIEGLKQFISREGCRYNSDNPRGEGNIGTRQG